MTGDDLTPYEPPPRDIIDGWVHQLAGVGELAEFIAPTDFVPAAYRGQAAAVAAAILTGRELGIGPLQSLQHLYVVDGRPAMSAQLMRALVYRAGHQLRIVESTNARCQLAGQRRGSGVESVVTWTMDDAKRAGVAGRRNWSTYPRQMLLARATAELCRGLFPDVIGGMYVPEELEDDPQGGVAPPPAPAPTRRVRRAKTPAAVEDVQAPPPPPPPDTTTPGPEPLDPEPAPGVDEATDGPGGISPPQRAHLFALLTQLGYMEPRQRRMHLVTKLVGRYLTSTSQLTRDEATALIDTLVRVTQQPDPDQWLGELLGTIEPPGPDPTLFDE